MMADGKKRKTETIMRRKNISLEDKIEIINRLEDGETPSAIGKSLSLSESTVRTIHKNEDSIRKTVAEGCLVSAKRVSRTRDIDLVKMEDALMIWVEECAHKNVPLSGSVLRERALDIYQQLKQDGRSSKDERSHSFSASKGWLQCFKRRFSLHFGKLQGEQASADIEAAVAFQKQLNDVILRENYSADQIFNADETALYWKKMPSRTCVSKNGAGFRAPKDRITLLVCSNASGDFMLQPLVVNRALHPRAMKNTDISRLPVLWRANEKAWITQTILDDWFHNHFVPSSENYLRGKGSDFKVLLLMDNVTCPDSDLSHPNVEVLCFPPNCTSLIQPLEQGVLQAIKAKYIRLAFEIILDTVKREDNKDFIHVWREFSILDCIEAISTASREMQPSALNACWRNLIPQMVEKENFVPPASDEYSRIMSVASQLEGVEGLQDMKIQDVEELVKDASDLECGEQETLKKVKNRELDEPSYSGSYSMGNLEESVPKLTLSGVQKGLTLGSELERHFAKEDPSIIRRKKFKRELQNCLAPYRELLERLQRDEFVTASSS